MLVDIHCHILPRVDDGSPDMETSRAMIRDAYEQGVRYIIATPHYRSEMFEPSMKKVIRVYHELRDYAEEVGIGLRLGCEYYRNEQMIRHLDKKLRPTMLGSRYVLTEFSTNDSFVTVRNYIYELITKGYRPIVAHVERYFCCQEPERIQKLKKLGAQIQINADSVLGYEGHTIKKFCAGLMKDDLVDFIGSDAHNLEGRKMNLGKCAAYVRKKMGQDYAEEIFIDNPRRIWKSR